MTMHEKAGHNCRAKFL